MRILIFSLCFVRFVCTTTTTQINDPYQLRHNQDAITFLIRETCKKADGDSKKFVIPDNNDQYTGQSCADSIGFMPITEKKVQIFITTSKKSLTNNDNVKKISLKIGTPHQTILTCEPNSVEPKIEQPFENKVTVEKGHIKQFASEVIQCDSVYYNLNTKEELEKDWGLVIEYDLSNDETISGILDTLNVNNLFAKTRCDSDKLVIGQDPNTEGKTHKQIAKMPGKADIVEKDTDDKKIKTFLNTKIDASVMCNGPFKMTYKINNAEEKEALRVECRKVPVDESDNAIQEFRYVVDTPDGKKIKTEKDDKIEVNCFSYSCQSCPEPTMAFCNDQECKKISQKPEKQFNGCRSLDTGNCKSKIIALNDKFEALNAAGDIQCGIDGKYSVNNKIVDTIACAQQYDALKNLPNVANYSDSEEPRNCQKREGCECLNIKNWKNLAIVSNKNSEWLRVKYLKFNETDNTWIYNRTNKVNVEQQHILKNGRLVRCIANVLELKEQPNSSKSLVVGINIVFNIIFIAVVIPAVIFIVNTRVKKREALKAAKANKKKEEQSGDKKDADAKKDDKKNEDKKNEA